MPNAFRVYTEESVKWKKAKVLEEMRLKIGTERQKGLGEAERQKKKVRYRAESEKQESKHKKQYADDREINFTRMRNAFEETEIEG